MVVSIRTVHNPHKDLQKVLDDRVNVEILSGDKILVPGVDPPYQFLDEGGADRTITLVIPNTKEGRDGRFFLIKHNGHSKDTHFLEIKQGITTVDKIYAQVTKTFIFDGTNWIGEDIGTGPTDNYQGVGIGRQANPYECGISIGWFSDGHLDGIAIGHSAKGYNYGVGIGYSTDGKDKGVAVGAEADGYSNGVAVGYYAKGYTNGTALGHRCNTNSKYHSIAIGYLSKNTREAELAINICDEVSNDMEYQYQQIVIGSWVRKTTDATPTLMRVDGKLPTQSRFTMRPQSALTFKIMVTARDDTTGDCAAYLFDGLIKRDGANNTTLCICNKTVLHEDDVTWDCDVTADDTNEALQITVTGDTDNLVRWAARLDGVETSFATA